MYGNIIDFYNNYFKSQINSGLWLDHGVKQLVVHLRLHDR